MADLNKVMLVGRLTREPEVHQFENGGKVTNLGFVVNNRRKNAASGEWEEVPVWLNLKAFNREHGRQLADLAALLTKGRQVFVEGHLALEEWTGKEDGKRHSRTLIYVDGIEFLGARPGGAGHEAGGQEAAHGGARQTKAAGTGAGEAGAEPESPDQDQQQAPSRGAIGTGGAGGDGMVFGSGRNPGEAGKGPKRVSGRPKRE